MQKITQNQAKTMDNLRETMMKQIKNQHSLNPTQISLFEDRLKNIVSQFHTPHHLPYAAMIQRAIQELKQKGGATEKSISEFIEREYDDLPWAHCSLLKHHLGFLAERGEIIMTRGFRYSLCGAGSSLGSVKRGKKHRRKKMRWSFERKQAKRLKLAIVVRSQKENEIEVIKYPSQVNDKKSQVSGNAVLETEKCQNDGHQTPEHDGSNDTVLLQLTDGGENDICSGSKAMDNDHPPLLVLTDGRENQGLELMGVEVSDSQACSIADSHPLHTSKHIATEGNLLPAPTVSPLPSRKKQQHRKALSTPVAERLENNDLPHILQPIQEKKQEKRKGIYQKGRQFDKMLEQGEVLLALPQLQKGSPPSRDRPMQNERACRQLRRWSGNLPDIGQTVRHSTQLLELPHLQKGSPLPRDGPMQNERSCRQLRRWSGDLPDISHTVCQSTQLLALPQQNKDMPLNTYQRRGKRPKAKTCTIIQDELPPADTQKKEAEELPKLLCYHIQQEKTSEGALTKEEFTLPNHKDSSDKVHQLEPPKLRRAGRPPKRKLVVNKGEDNQSSTRNKLKKSSHHRAQKIKRNLRVHVRV